jgi:hypothetical protein
MKQNKYAQSVRQRLLNLAKSRNDDFQLILTRYGLERILARLALSEFKDDFVLKGAMLFQIWSEQAHRATRDMDFLSFGNSEIESLEKVFRTICEIEIPEDGIVFDLENIISGTIKADQEYEGVRLQIPGLLERTRIPIRIDIGFGDVVKPKVLKTNLPTLLDFPKPLIRTYPPETVIAEKFHALVDLGMTNSRLKDFYDLHFLIQNFRFEKEILAEAVKATFGRRKTDIPKQMPIALTEEFSANQDKRQQWKAFLKRTNISEELDLEEVIDNLHEFFSKLLIQCFGQN